MIEVYDLAGADDRRFSPFCARTKAALRHKGLDYSTVPIRFCDKDKLAFSEQERVPVIVDDGRVVADSWKIAEYLEDRSPDPALFPGPGMKEACRFFTMYVDRTLHPALFPVVVYDIFEKIEPVDRAYFRESREARLAPAWRTSPPSATNSARGSHPCCPIWRRSPSATSTCSRY